MTMIKTYEQLRDEAAEKWTKKYPWEKFMYEDKCGMSAKKQAERPSDIPSNLENAFRAGADWQHERKAAFAILIEELEAEVERLRAALEKIVELGKVRFSGIEQADIARDALR